MNYPCDHYPCDYVAYDIKGLRTHKFNKHSAGNLKPGVKGPLTALKKHVSPEPESIVKGSRHECDYCKFVGISPDVLRTHKESNHQCRNCCYQGSSSELMCHKRFRHKDLQHPCDQCEYATNDVEDFNLHKEMRHKTSESNIVNPP